MWALIQSSGNADRCSWRRESVVKAVLCPIGRRAKSGCGNSDQMTEGTKCDCFLFQQLCWPSRLLGVMLVPCCSMFSKHNIWQPKRKLSYCLNLNKSTGIRTLTELSPVLIMLAAPGWKRWSTTFIQTEISQQPFDGLLWIFVQTFIFPSGWFLITCDIKIPAKPVPIHLFTAS